MTVQNLLLPTSSPLEPFAYLFNCVASISAHTVLGVAVKCSNQMHAFCINCTMIAGFFLLPSLILARFYERHNRWFNTRNSYSTCTYHPLDSQHNDVLQGMYEDDEIMRSPFDRRRRPSADHDHDDDAIHLHLGSRHASHMGGMSDMAGGLGVNRVQPYGLSFELHVMLAMGLATAITIVDGFAP